MAVDPSTIFLGIAFIATMLTIGGFIIPSITLRVGSAFLWLICAIFILFSPTLYVPSVSADNVTGLGTNGYLAQWTGVNTLGDSTNTDSDISNAVQAMHSQNTDTHSSAQDANLNMNNHNITNVDNITTNNKDLTLITGTGKTLIFDTPIWDDLRTPVTSVKLSSTKPPSVVKYKGTEVYSFSSQKTADNEEEVFFTLQLPHGYKESSDIEAHMHFAFPANTTNVVRFGLDYAWANIDQSIPAVDTLYFNHTGTNDADIHNMQSFGTISGAGKTISSMILCRLFRNSSSASDNYTGSVDLLEVDFHYQRDTIGSRGVITK
jgi:hypothetical protein